MALNPTDKFISNVKEKYVNLTLKHRYLISKELKKLGDLKDHDKIINAELSVSEKLEEYLNFYKERVEKLPLIKYNEDLPVFSKKDEIVDAIKNNQVVIVAGETGSGKTTQLPKMCLEAGLGLKGLIGHTQPRRIAARAVSTRIAKELDETLGQSVGYKVRFTDVTSEKSYIKLMTDGILLSETSSDRLLLSYDCIIIDEAHERSLNIDFLLGYLKQLLIKRPDLKLVITSATINTKRFSEHFNNAPVIEVSGRTYPVEVVYMPLDENSEEDDETENSEIDLRCGIQRAINMLFHEYGRGDVLVFLPGEREIMDIAAFLRKANLKGCEILPLYARLATSEQNHIFEPHDLVRIVLCTNIAETSLTVPGIKYVIDPGTARISRYSPRTKVQRLPVEKNSKASADQRKGRCGRVSEGVCVRLYSKEDFDLRDDFTDPEILRTNLAAVILQMVALRLGSITSFPFIDPPLGKQVSDGIRLLEELGAITGAKGLATDELRLTKTGQYLSKLPCDPRLGRMLIEAAKEGSLNEVLIIVSALAVMDPRERPADRMEQSSQLHHRFDDEKSDFLSYINLYSYIRELQGSLSNSALRRRLKTEYLSYLRIREWFDLLRQLRTSCQLLKFTINTEPSAYDSVHKAIVSGLLSQIGRFDDQEKGNYLGARGIRFVIHPSSSLSKRKPKWICSAELNETSRLFARTVAGIDPLWLENIASHLIKKTYSEPSWSKKQGAVTALMTITLYGLKIVTDRRCLYTNIDPDLCRTLFIRDALVGGDYDCKFDFFKKNLELVDSVVYLEDKLRRRDLLCDESVLEEFYDKRLPKGVVSVRHFEKWWREKLKQDPNYLDFSLDLITSDNYKNASSVLYPEYFVTDKFKLPLTYVFEPGKKNDGVSVHIPLTLLNRVSAIDFQYQIEGFRADFLTALIKSLPKRLRRNLIPAPDYAAALNEAIGSRRDGDIYTVAAKELTRMGGEIITPEDFDRTLIPVHLFMNFVIEDENGKEVKQGRDLKSIVQSLQGNVKDALKKVVNPQSEAKTSTTWDFGTVKKEQITRQGSIEITAYPALTVKGKEVGVELFENRYLQMEAMKKGVCHLLSLTVKDPAAYLEKHLPNKSKLAMYYQPLGQVRDLINDLVMATIALIVDENGGPCWDEESYKALEMKVRGSLNEEALKLCSIVEKILFLSHDILRLLKGGMNFATVYSCKDIQKCLDSLVYKGFISATEVTHLKELPRYLEALKIRFEKLNRDVNKDLMYTRKLEELNEEYKNTLSRYRYTAVPDDLKNVRWLLEELKVSYFAQQLGAKCQVSDRRILNELKRILTEYPDHS